jgi:hypothetical protein
MILHWKMAYPVVLAGKFLRQEGVGRHIVFDADRYSCGVIA